MEPVTRKQKFDLYRKLCQSGLSTAQIDEERTRIVRQLRSEGVSDRTERQTLMWESLAATHLGCDLDGNLLPVQSGDAAGGQTPSHRPVSPEAPWPFRISQHEADCELEAGNGRTSGYAERVEWVSQNLDNLSARPSSAPCNAAWSMLTWATENRKDFYAQQRQLMSRRELEQAEKELQRDFARFEELMQRFSCWKRIGEKIDAGEIEVYTPNMPRH